VASDTLFNQFKTGIGTAGEQLKSLDGYVDYTTSRWLGTLTALDNKQLYVVKTTGSHLLKFTGSPVNPAAETITIRSGWNWIGYTPQFNLPIADALASIMPATGDQIKSQSGYRQYSGGEWIGTLNYLKPGEGYMYFFGNEDEQTLDLVYPSVSSTLRSVSEESSEAPVAHWTFDKHKYPNTMTVTHYVSINNVECKSDQVEVAAFIGEECRGTTFLQQEEGDDLPHSYIGFLMIFGESNEPITFKIYDHAAEIEYEARASVDLNFVADDKQGSPVNPLRIATQTTDIDQVVDGLSIYPNPVVDVLNIRCAGEIESLEILDLSGRRILMQTDLPNKSVDVAALSPGTYLLKLGLNDGRSFIRKFTKE
jgi:hypothetical protein